MKGIGGRDWKVGICLSVITILGAAVLYLLYQNFLAEQMLYELNQDYEDVVKELEESKACHIVEKPEELFYLAAEKENNG